MHIPDGFLTAPMAIGTSAVAALALSRTIRSVSRDLDSKMIPQMGLLSAFVFMLQLVSFPVIGGTSVHLTGALLVSILLGPGMALVSISVALIALALMFQHGGLLSLGANVINIAITGTYLAYGFYRMIPGRRVSIVLAAVLANLIAALLCAGELALSDMFELATGLKGMLLIYGTTGIIEGLATLMILQFIERVRPDLIMAGK